MAGLNVTVFAPDSTVSSMADEVADGSVERAAQAAVAAFTSIDTDGKIPTVTYGSDFDDAIAIALQAAEDTDGADLVVVITDLNCNQPERAEQLLTELAEAGNFVLIVPVSNQGYNKTWAEKLDNEHPGATQIDVVTADDLGNPEIAMAEVRAWARSA